MKVKSVLSVRRSGGEAAPGGGAGGAEESRAFQEGKAKGLKSLQFNLVDCPADMAEMEPITYQATISNAKGILLEGTSIIESTYFQSCFIYSLE